MSSSDTPWKLYVRLDRTLNKGRRCRQVLLAVTPQNAMAVIQLLASHAATISLVEESEADFRSLAADPNFPVATDVAGVKSALFPTGR